MADRPFLALSERELHAFESSQSIVCVCSELRENECGEAAGDPSVRRANCVYRRLTCQVRRGAGISKMQSLAGEMLLEQLAQVNADQRRGEPVRAAIAAVEQLRLGDNAGAYRRADRRRAWRSAAL